ncbi:MAG: ABC transporter permease subunit [Candidatus Heimdallarchaeota archaeon]|nr:MAG: ABC transporter permease subunit [Candidatus Heimdallarchaeota archaeon]
MNVLSIYTKQIRKNWLIWFLPILVLTGMSFLMVAIWPSFEEYMAGFGDLLEQPFYKALLPEGADFTSVEGFIAMEIFTMADIFFMALILLFGIQLVNREVDSGTMDFVLSFPVPRWRFILEKVFAYITVTFSFPVFSAGIAIVGAEILGVELKPHGGEAYFLALVGKWLLYFTMTCVVILISVIFMDTGKTLAFGGLFVGGSYLLKTIGGLVTAADPDLATLLREASFYHYLDGGRIMNKVIETGGLTSNLVQEFLGMAIIAAVLIALTIIIFDNPLFQKREFTYV